MSKRKIISELSCPRCNALSFLKLEETEGETDILMMYHICNKCKYKKFKGTTTYKIIKLENFIKKLEELKPGNAMLRVFQKNKIQKLKKEIDLLKLGLK